MSTDLYGVRVLDVDRARRRVRLRVFVVHYEPSWGTNELLPEDPSFFFRVLWEGARGTGSMDGTDGPLADLVRLDDYLDEAWVDRHTHRFVSGVERVAARNHPLDDEAWDSLATYYYERDGGWQDEHLLAQGDYEVQVTDPRWLAGLCPGQSWGTGAHASRSGPAPRDGRAAAERIAAEYAALAARGDAGAAFVLGWLRQEEGDIPGAAAAYRLAAGTADADERAKALLYLADLQAEQGEAQAARAAYEEAVACSGTTPEGERYRARAALGLGTLRRVLGDEGEAQAAYALAERCGSVGLVREARRLAGTETWAERTCRVLRDADRDAALRLLADVCRSEAVARFGTALAGRDFDRARSELAGLLDPADLENAAAFALDLAAVWLREEDGPAVDRAVELVAATGWSSEGYGRALDEGLIEARSGRTSRAEQIAFRLFRLLKDGADLDAVARLAGTAEQPHPRVAARAFHLLGATDMERGDLEAAAGWLRRGAALCEPDPDAAAAPAYELGVVCTALGEPVTAREAFGQAEKGFIYLGDRARAARRLAELLDGQGEWPAACAAWIRAAFHQARLELGGEEDAAWSVHRLGQLLAEAGERRTIRTARQLAGEAPQPGTAPMAGTCAAYHFAHWIRARGHGELALALLRAIVEASEGTGKHAAGAAVTLGATAFDKGEDDTARAWWVRALGAGHAAMAHRATMNLASLAKRRSDLPETLRLLTPVADSGHRDAALAAAHIAELHYWLQEKDEALRWYRRTLDATDDPALVGEAAYRIGEILHDGGDPDTARQYLERAATTGDPAFAPQAIALLAGVPST
jgi:tetratricopeptide (TPR) repeat protein